MFHGELAGIDFGIIVGIVTSLEAILAGRQGRQGKVAARLDPHLRLDSGLAEGHDPRVSFPSGGYVLDPAANAAAVGASDVERLLLFQSD